MTSQQRTEAEAIFFTGVEQMGRGEVAAAEASFQSAIALAPDFAEAYANLGFLLEHRHDAAAAESCYRRSIALNPTYAETHLNLGGLLANQKRFREAEAAYRQAIALQPEAPVGWSNLGALYACLKRESEAEDCYRKAIALDGSYATARFNLSYVLLRQGRFEEGWTCFEARSWYAALAARLSCPRWQGETLVGKSLLLGYEAGHGDMLQFCRYAAMLKAQGAASLTLLCHPALKTLLVELESVDTIIGFDEPLPLADWDYWTPLLSIPYHCQTRLASIPAQIPYLRAPAERIEKWSKLLPEGNLRVGLVWKGNPQFENDADRSLPALELLAPLGTVAGVNFVSLQKGAGEDEARQPPEGLSLTPLGDRMQDFADTAAVISQLDLVISVDTAVAHLAGALGKPCWVLLPEYMTDWRWLTGRSDSPWYPGIMHLFRQTQMGDWQPVVAEVSAALSRWVS